MAVLAIPVLSALASHHNAKILMRLVVEQTSVIMMMWISADQLATVTHCESVETLAHGGTALGFVVFPTAFFLFIYIKDVGMINDDIMIEFSSMTSKLSPNIKIIVSIQCD